MKRGKRRVSWNPTGEAPLRFIDFVSLSLPTQNPFFSDEIHRKSSSTEKDLLLLRLCGRVCAAGEAELPSDHIAGGIFFFHRLLFFIYPLLPLSSSYIVIKPSDWNPNKNRFDDFFCFRWAKLLRKKTEVRPFLFWCISELKKRR